MSKSNVNPNHYKVAGRERQGEDVAQARNKQKHAENVARRRTEIGARSQKPAPQLGAASPDAAPTRAAKTATQEAGATPPEDATGAEARAQPGSRERRAPREISEGRARRRPAANRGIAKGKREAGHEEGKCQAARVGQAKQTIHGSEAGDLS